jgi:hypothetical protein
MKGQVRAPKQAALMANDQPVSYLAAKWADSRRSGCL